MRPKIYLLLFNLGDVTKTSNTQERQPEEARAGAHRRKEVQVCTVHTRQVVQG